MDDEAYLRITSTMPWTRATKKHNGLVLVELRDKDGNEVPLFDLITFAEMISARIANRAKK